MSYSHQEQAWVRGSLVPCLEAGGAKILIDYLQFQAGRTLIGQMDATQDQADVHLLVITPAYLASPPCFHEMERAVACDPDFTKGKVVPVIRETCPSLPGWLTTPGQPLYVDLRDDRQPRPWDRVMTACGATLGVSAPEWLAARKEICTFLERDESVNLVVRAKGVKWRELLAHIQKDLLPDLGLVRLSSGATVSRRGLVEEMLRAAGIRIQVPHGQGEDLVTLAQAFEGRTTKVRLALTDFDMVLERPEYDWNLFAALRDLMTRTHKLVLLIQSTRPFAELLPPACPLSSPGASSIHCVELGAVR